MMLRRSRLLSASNLLRRAPSEDRSLYHRMVEVSKPAGQPATSAVLSATPGGAFLQIGHGPHGGAFVAPQFEHVHWVAFRAGHRAMTSLRSFGLAITSTHLRTPWRTQ